MNPPRNTRAALQSQSMDFLFPESLSLSNCTRTEWSLSQLVLEENCEMQFQAVVIWVSQLICPLQRCTNSVNTAFPLWKNVWQWKWWIFFIWKLKQHRAIELTSLPSHRFSRKSIHRSLQFPQAHLKVSKVSLILAWDWGDLSAHTKEMRNSVSRISFSREAITRNFRKCQVWIPGNFVGFDGLLDLKHSLGGAGIFFAAFQFGEFLAPCFKLRSAGKEETGSQTFYRTFPGEILEFTHPCLLILVEATGIEKIWALFDEWRKIVRNDKTFINLNDWLETLREQVDGSVCNSVYSASRRTWVHIPSTHIKRNGQTQLQCP